MISAAKRRRDKWLKNRGKPRPPCPWCGAAVQSGQCCATGFRSLVPRADLLASSDCPRHAERLALYQERAAKGLPLFEEETVNGRRDSKVHH